MTSCFGKGLKFIMSDRSIKLRQLSEMTGLSVPYLSEITRGVKYPNEPLMTKIAASLDLLPEDIMIIGRKLSDIKI